MATVSLPAHRSAIFDSEVAQRRCAATSKMKPRSTHHSRKPTRRSWPRMRSIFTAGAGRRRDGRVDLNYARPCSANLLAWLGSNELGHAPLDCRVAPTTKRRTHLEPHQAMQKDLRRKPHTCRRPRERRRRAPRAREILKWGEFRDCANGDRKQPSSERLGTQAALPFGNGEVWRGPEARQANLWPPSDFLSGSASNQTAT
jgi:hypothetical protein